MLDTDRAERQRMIELAGSLGWPRLDIPRRAAGPGAKRWRSFARVASPAEIASAMARLDAGLEAEVFAPTVPLW
jgi:hypothetical protein